MAMVTISPCRLCTALRQYVIICPKTLHTMASFQSIFKNPGVAGDKTDLFAMHHSKVGSLVSGGCCGLGLGVRMLAECIVELHLLNHKPQNKGLSLASPTSKSRSLHYCRLSLRIVSNSDRKKSSAVGSLIA